MIPLISRRSGEELLGRIFCMANDKSNIKHAEGTDTTQKYLACRSGGRSTDASRAGLQIGLAKGAQTLNMTVAQQACP